MRRLLVGAVYVLVAVIIPGGLVALSIKLWRNRCRALLWMAGLGPMFAIIADKLAHLLGCCLGF